MRTLFTKNSTVRNRNFVHPPNPPLILLIVGLLLLSSGISAKAQLMNYDTYAISLKSYYNKLWAAERAEFVDIEQGKKWNMVPSFGVAFGLPSINMNTGQIAAYKARQAEVKAKLKSIDMKYEVQLNEGLNNLKIEISKANNAELKLDDYSSVLAARGQIFKIYQEAFNKKEMKPIDFYKEKLIIETANQEYQRAVRDFQVMILEIEKLARYDMPQELIYYDGNSVAEGASNLMMVHPSKLPPGLVVKPVQPARAVGNRLGN